MTLPKTMRMPGTDSAAARLRGQGLGRVILKKQRHQRDLFESERSFRLLVEGVADYALYMLDPNGIITSWNIGGQRIKGYSAEDILGEHFSRFYTEIGRASCRERV